MVIKIQSMGEKQQGHSERASSQVPGAQNTLVFMGKGEVASRIKLYLGIWALYLWGLLCFQWLQKAGGKLVCPIRLGMGYCQG